MSVTLQNNIILFITILLLVVRRVHHNHFSLYCPLANCDCLLSWWRRIIRFLIEYDGDKLVITKRGTQTPLGIKNNLRHTDHKKFHIQIGLSGVCIQQKREDK